MQCGRCWPCLIRRAAFFKAGLEDRTDYQVTNLKDILSEPSKTVDLRAVLYALYQYDRNGIKSSPIRSIRNISGDSKLAASYHDVVCRGFEELREFLFDQNVWQ